ncbi:MAG: hypothetical protein QNI91_16890, partial [Arenicellales bacterium]|nr:hypothetical protein [Arenicellales bacterium]
MPAFISSLNGSGTPSLSGAGGGVGPGTDHASSGETEFRVWFGQQPVAVLDKLFPDLLFLFGKQGWL